MASTPSGGFLPAQRKLSAPRRRARSGDRSILWLCSWTDTGCRSRREAPGPSQPPLRSPTRSPRRNALGLAYRPRARYGERVLEAGSRRQSRGHGGGLSMILRTAQAVLAGERALVEGRRPGIGEAVVLDGTAVEAVPGGFTGRVGPKGRAGSGGIATEGVRGYVASSARGRKRRSREVPRGGAFDRSSARTAWHHELTPVRSG